MRNTLNRNIRKLDKLYILADQNNIPVDESCPENILSMSVRFEDGTKIIGISNDTNNEYTKLERMAHEMGHCMTDSFYAGYSPYELRVKHERRADAWAANNIIPFRELCRAVKNGYREIWELAEYFGVSQEFVEKAIDIHARNGKTVPESLYNDV